MFEGNAYPLRPPDIPIWITNFDLYSSVSLHAKLNFEEKTLSKATVFTYVFNDKIYLVSNWHVFSGRDRVTGDPLDNNAAVPYVVRPHFYINDSRKLAWAPFDIRLENDGQPTWYEHPHFGRKVDVAVLPLELPQELCAQPINRLPSTRDLEIEIGQDLFVLGFPADIRAAGIWPVWKRASVASEPGALIDTLPLMLVDSSAYKGMSGAPVIAKSFNSYLSKDGHRKADFNVGVYYRFVGIYSGARINKEGERTQICEVWNASVIENIIQSACRPNIIY